MKESTWYRIKYSIGYVFENNKLIITIPVGILDTTKESFEERINIIDIERDIVLSSEGISIGESCRDNISMLLNESPQDAIMIIDRIINRKTGEDLDNAYIKTKEVYYSEKEYLKKGYMLIKIDEFNNTIEEYNFE
jgi:hypothetical protein